MSRAQKGNLDLHSFAGWNEVKKRSPAIAWRGSLAILLLFSVHLLAGPDSEKWTSVLGGPTFEQSFIRQSSRLENSPLTPEKMADEGMACAGFVNAYQVSHAPRYRRRAREIADYLVANSNLAGDGIPGWGPKLDEGYGFCPDKDNFQGKNLWDSTRALACLLKVSEIEPSRAYVELAERVVDHWPSEEKRLAGEEPYASQGMRFYRKEPESCARKYVKNTNIAMGEVLFRLAKQTGEKRYTELGEQVLNSELWEILTRRNFGYHGAMIYVEPNDPQNREVLKKEQKKVEKDAKGNIVCRGDPPDPSCWDHLAFEAYELYQIQLLVGRDLSDPTGKIMSIYRTSPLGDTQRFPWEGGDSPTQITAYNCFLRNSGKDIYGQECRRALEHQATGSMIFYSLIPDDLGR
jgi:hypothetical protein